MGLETFELRWIFEAGDGPFIVELSCRTKSSSDSNPVASGPALDHVSGPNCVCEYRSGFRILLKTDGR